MTKALNEAKALLSERDRFLILSHRRPDGDTVGSSAALCLALRALGKQADILENPQLTPRYAPYWQGLTRTDVPEDACIISVDVAAPDMLLPGAEHLADRIELCLDHHETNPGYAGINCIAPDYAAAGDLIYELLQFMELPLDKTMAEALYLAVSTDTGGFRHANTDAHAFLVAAACCAAGADIFPMNRSLFAVKSPARIRLESELGASIRFFSGGKIALCTLSIATMQRLGATEDDADDLSNYPRSIEGVELGILIRELAGNVGKLSLRAGDGFNAAELCAALGGGGHRAAAGASIPGGIEAAEEAILRVLRDAGVEL